MQGVIPITKHVMNQHSWNGWGSFVEIVFPPSENSTTSNFLFLSLSMNLLLFIFFPPTFLISSFFLPKYSIHLHLLANVCEQNESVKETPASVCLSVYMSVRLSVTRQTLTLTISQTL